MKERIRQEEVISNATLVWNQLILPQWDTMYDHSVCVCVVSQLHHENVKALLFPDPIVALQNKIQHMSVFIITL